MTGPGLALQRLLTWLSPSFPVGAFAWSAGLETAIGTGVVHSRATTQDWIEGGLHHGALHTDAIVLAHGWRSAGDANALRDLADLAIALTPARERIYETTTMGAAFITAASAWPSDHDRCLPDPCPYPIAVGAIAGGHGIPINDTLAAFLTAAVHTQISVAVRLVPIGQTDGLKIVAALESAVRDQADVAANAGLDDLGTIAYAADIAQMQHELLPTRIFRS